MNVHFDTRDKKPAVYNIAALSAVVLAGLLLMMRTEGPQTLLRANVLMIVYCAAVVVLLLRAFFGQLEYNPYSYNTIYYTGFALFVFSLLVTHVYTAVNCVLQPGAFDQTHLTLTLLHSAKNYMLFTSPFLLVFSAALFLSNVALIRHEGRRFVNVLGILLAFLLVGGEIVLVLVNHFTGADRPMVLELFLNLFAAGYLYFECMIIGAIIANAIAARHEPNKDKDYIIVLGCGIRRDGTPTPLLRGRLDRALSFAREQEARTGKAPAFVVSGGQGPNEVVSEAECMRSYLAEQGIPAEQILVEDQSADTGENMRFSKEKIMAVANQPKIAYSTTNYHVFRAGLKARRVKMRAVGMGAPTKWYFWPNAAVREFVGLLTEHRGKQALILLGMVILYTTLTILAFGRA